MQAEGACAWRRCSAVWDRAGGAAWVFDDWQRQFGAELRATARDVTGAFGVKPAAEVAARFEQMMVRGASRVRAAQAAPTALRHAAVQADVAVAALREPYARFFAMEEVDVRFRRFDGSMSPQVTRAAFIACDAVTVLPYDPVRDRVLVIDQFRAGPVSARRSAAVADRGDCRADRSGRNAGRGGAARGGRGGGAGAGRSAAGGAAITQAPGCSSEFLYSFVALTDLPDTAAGVFGVEGEAEDIRGHLLSFDRLMALVASGEISNAPTMLTRAIGWHRTGIGCARLEPRATDF